MNNQTTTIGAVLAGTQGLIKAGAGTLQMNVAGAYTGGTTITNGTSCIIWNCSMAVAGSISGLTTLAVRGHSPCTVPARPDVLFLRNTGPDRFGNGHQDR